MSSTSPTAIPTKGVSSTRQRDPSRPASVAALLFALAFAIAPSASAQNGNDDGSAGKSALAETKQETENEATPAKEANAPTNDTTSEESAEKKSVLVLDFNFGEGIRKDNAKVLTQEVATILAKDKTIRVQTMEDSRVTLGVDAQKQLLGCDQSSCLAEIAQAMGTDMLLFGRLDRIGDQVTLQMTLLESTDARPLVRSSAKDKDVASILKRMDVVLLETKAALNPALEVESQSSGLSPLLLAGGASVGLGAALAVGGAIVGGVAFAQMADAKNSVDDRNFARTVLFLPAVIAGGVGVLALGAGGAITGLGLIE